MAQQGNGVPDSSAQTPLSRPPLLPGLQAPGGAAMGLPSLHAVVSDPDVQQGMLSNQIADVSVHMGRSAMLSGAIEKDFRSVGREMERITQNATRAAEAYLRTIERTAQLHQQAQGGLVNPTTGQPFQSPATNGGPAATPPARTAGSHALFVPNRGAPFNPGINPSRAQGQDPHGNPLPRNPGNAHHPMPLLPDPNSGSGDAPLQPMDFVTGRSTGLKPGLIGQSIATRIDAWYSQRSPGKAPHHVDASGTLWDVDDQGHAVAPSADQHAARQRLDSFARRSARYGRTAGALNTLSRGEGLSGVISKVLPRAAGPLGVAVGAGAFALSQTQSQREKNLFYQQISGGSNASAFRQRGQEYLAGLRGIGTMGVDQSRELFRMASETGFKGQTRSDMIDFARHNYMNTGTDLNLSMEMIQRSITNGVTDFTSLQKALDNVSQSARDSGRNVKEAQENFQKAFEAVSTTLGGGSAAPLTAANLRTTSTSLGLANSEVDFSGMLNAQQRMMQATLLGQNPQTFLANGNNPTAVAQGQQAAITSVRGTQFGGSALADVQRLAQEKAKNGRINETDADEIGRELVSSGQVNMQAIQAQLAAYGVQTNDANIFSMITRIALPNGIDFVGDAQKNADAENSKRISFSDASSVNGVKVKGADSTSKAELAKTLGFDVKSTASHPGRGAYSASNPYTISGMNSTESAGLSTYEKMIGKSGQRDAAVENLLRKGALDDRTQVVVSTKDGDRQVTLAQAIKDYRDQLDNGSARLTGTQQGKTVGDITGITQSGEAASSNASAKSGKVASNVGDGTISIGLTTEAKRLFNVTASGGMFAQDAARAGIPATPYPKTTDLYSARGN